MEYSVEELSRSCNLSVDTVRYYQGRGLLAPPRKLGRRAVYDQRHVDRLRIIRSMADKGLPLKVISTLLDPEPGQRSDRALLAALEKHDEQAGISSTEMAARLGVPRSLLTSVEKTGLAEPQLDQSGAARYSRGDLEAAREALKLLDWGFPLHRLLALALKHDRAVRRMSDEAIDLFNSHVRKKNRGSQEADPEEVARAFRAILPAVTGLVAHHFQRVLVNRALKRLKKSGDKGPLRVALRESGRHRVGLKWT
ncbi:MAG: MerR family transcriptional regulator [Proteobacteria bacterium]|nr:MerR family transcriptional regulator [Pseudomonadota bacterium]